MARGVCYGLLALDGLVAWAGDEPAGALTYVIEGDRCEIVTIDAFRERRFVAAVQ